MMRVLAKTVRRHFVSLAKTLLYCSGVLGTYHRFRNRRVLTVVIFHRVLPAGDLRWQTADPEWKVSEEVFRSCLRFFVKHYQVVSMEQVRKSLNGQYKLPDRALLITLDDGWADTEEYALRLLHEMSLPAVVFVVVDAVEGGEMWQETVRRLWRSQASRERVYEAMDSVAPGGSAWRLDKVIQVFSGLTAERRRKLIGTLQSDCSPCQQKVMASTSQVRALDAGHCYVGSHGMTHTSITLASDPWWELHESRVSLGRMLGKEEGPAFFSFPNGRYNASAVMTARQAGYTCLFTSDPYLNHVGESEARPAAVLGRVNISQNAITDDRGRTRPELLASTLFWRPVRPVQRLD